MQCELCGREGETVPALIEGVELNACAACARHGQILKKPIFVKIKNAVPAEEPEIEMVSDYALLIKKKREGLGLNQEDFAKMVNEKASTMHSIESGHLKPDMKLAEKLRKTFGLRLVEEVKKEKSWAGKAKSSELTIGDLINKKK